MLRVGQGKVIKWPDISIWCYNCLIMRYTGNERMPASCDQAFGCNHKLIHDQCSNLKLIFIKII
jgi:hypothetical protein